MRMFTYSQARQRLSEVLNAARHEEVLIRRKNGEVFSLRLSAPLGSPLDVPGVKTKATTADILAAVRASRAGTRR